MSSLVFVGDRLCIAEHGSVAINVWRGPPQAEDWRTSSRHLATLHTRNPAGIFALVVFPQISRVGLSAFDVDRPTMENVARQFISFGKGCATVIEGSGFIPASIRSVVSGLTLITRPPFPSRIFDTTTGAVDWLVPLTKVKTPQAFRTELESKLERAREALYSRTPPGGNVPVTAR